MSEKENSAPEENTNKEKSEGRLKSNAALWIMFALIATGVIFLLSMRYIERNGIEDKAVTVYIETVIYAESEAESQDSFLIDINTADRDELMKIPGIGPSKADAILEYRKEYGGFYEIEEIMNVRGIGEGIFNKIKNHISAE